MITDPTTLLALALCVGILGLVVLILPLLILFWSQMEPQLIGLVARDANGADDEYPSQTVLPRLMKSFGNMAELEREKAAKKPARKAPAKPKARKSSATTSRSKATTTSKTVKAAPSKPKKATSKAKAKPATPTKAKSGASANKPTVKKTKTTSPKPATKRTPAGAKRDPILGVVYSKKPKEIDDLKEIKGVAKVIEGKLNKEGIYTYRQIVEWDAAAIEAFSEKLSFKGRILNEGWQKQCAKFHKDKYDEKIG